MDNENRKAIFAAYGLADDQVAVEVMRHPVANLWGVQVSQPNMAPVYWEIGSARNFAVAIERYNPEVASAVNKCADDAQSRSR